MRKCKTVYIGNRRFEVMEFRVRDVRRMLSPTDEPGRVLDWLLPVSLGMAAGEVNRLTPETIDGLWTAVESVNKAFFSPAGTQSLRQGTVQPLGPKTLDRCVCRLTERGHAGVWDYGWGFFVFALMESARLEKDRIRSMALAVGLARGGKKAWRKFFS